MRNNWLPQQLARYVPGDELKQLHERGATIERDTQALIGQTASRKILDKTDLWTEEREASSSQKPKVAIEHVEVCRLWALM